MTDALRSDRPSPEGPDRERDARVEALLLAGLDHYFAGHHELAINVWTRVLFLDRGHARARAYIERARSAVAERQREADELLHAGDTALRDGDLVRARQLLTSAVERRVAGEEALALLQRLDRMETAGGAGAAPLAVGSQPNGQMYDTPEMALPAPSRGRTGPARDPRIAWVAAGAVAGVLLALVAAGYLWIVAEPIELNPAPAAGPLVAADPLPVPSPGELRVLRARHLAAGGRLHEALAVLESVPPDERDRRSVDDLRATIQRRLLDAAALPSSPVPGEPAQPDGARPSSEEAALER